MALHFRRFLTFLLLSFTGSSMLAQNSYLDSCLHALPSQKDDTNKVMLLNSIAWDISYQDLHKGLDYIKKADSLAIRLGFEQAFSNIDNTYGSIYMDMGMHDEALTHYLHGIKVAEKYHLDHQLANLLSNLAILQQRRKDFKKATASYLEALAILKKNKDSLRLFGIMNNLASNYYEQHLLDSAMYYYNICMEYNIAKKKELSLAYNYLNVSDIYNEKGDSAKALEFIKNAEKIARENKDNYVLSYSLAQHADLLLNQKKYAAALSLAQEAIGLAKKSSDLELTKSCEKKLSSIYQGLGDYKNALVHFQLYTDAKDSIMSVENNKQITSLEAQYGTEKKEKENKLLQAQNELNVGTIRHQKILTWFISGGLFITLLLMFFVFRGYKQKQKANELILLQKEEVEKQKMIVEQKNTIVEEKNKEILDSIHYAKRIQRAMLTSDSYLKKNLPEHFVLYKPKDIVSGDFYWSVKYEDKVYFVAADCTGHGVPGAFMSLVGISFLNEIVLERKITSPEKILNHLRDDIIKALNPEDASEEAKDGMDIVILCFDFANMNVTFAAANNPVYLVRNNELKSFTPDKFPVGKFNDDARSFTLQEFELQENDRIYCFTDGYADQFGGPHLKKYKYKQLKEKLISIHKLPMREQKQLLEQELENWRSGLEQVDDILVIGINI